MRKTTEGREPQRRPRPSSGEDTWPSSLGQGSPVRVPVQQEVDRKKPTRARVPVPTSGPVFNGIGGSHAKVSDDFTRGLIIPDTHAPYHNVKSWSLIEAVTAHYRPEIVVVLGDFFDCYAVSQHRKDPQRRATISDEIERGRLMLRLFHYCKSKYFIEGNHEWRLKRYLMDFAPEIYEYLLKQSDDDLFGLKREGWNVTPYMEAMNVGKLQLTHDLDKSGETAIHDAMSSFMDNVVIGHTHLFRYVVKGTAFGVPHVGASFGWLGDTTQIDYRHRVKSHRDYVQGFGTFRLNKENGYIYVNPVPIFGNTCCVEGKVYSI